MLLFVAEAETLPSDGEWINAELYRTLRRLMWSLLWSLVSGSCWPRVS